MYPRLLIIIYFLNNQNFLKLFSLILNYFLIKISIDINYIKYKDINIRNIYIFLVKI
jgi:hypothetical protein